MQLFKPEEIKSLLTTALPGATVQVIDTTGTSDHFQTVIVWPGFEGKSLLEQHQLVMTPLKEGLKGPIHALSIKTYTTPPQPSPYPLRGLCAGEGVKGEIK